MKKRDEHDHQQLHHIDEDVFAATYRQTVGTGVS